MKQRAAVMARHILLLGITICLFFCGQTRAALPAKKGVSYVTPASDTATTQPGHSIILAQKRVHLSFFQRLKMARNIMRLQHKQRNETSANGIVSLGLAGGSLVSFITLFALAATAGAGLLTGLFLLGTFMAIAAVVLGGIGLHKDRYRGIAITGMALGVAELLFFVVVGLVVVIFATAL